MPRKGRFGGIQREIALINLLKERIPEKFGPSAMVLSLASGDQWDIAILNLEGGSWHNVVLVEAKTSRKHIHYLSHDKDQYEMYMGCYRNFGASTWYAFRIVPKQGQMKLGGEAAYWRFFDISIVNGKLVWDRGLTLEQFMESIEKELRRGSNSHAT